MRGHFSRDGHEVVHLRSAADIILARNSAGAFEEVVEGQEGSNSIDLRP